MVVCFSFLNGGSNPQEKAVADQPEAGSSAPPEPVAEPKPDTDTTTDTGSATIVNGPEAHQAVIDNLTRAYNDIAEGYAQIGDAASIPRGEERITRGVERLKAAAQRGRSLPPLQPDEHAALTGSSGPSLLEAVDRVIQQLRRLKATPGIQSDFDRLIDAYTRTRQGIEREIQGSGTGPAQGSQFRQPPGPRPSSRRTAGAAQTFARAAVSDRGRTAPLHAGSVGTL